MAELQAFECTIERNRVEPEAIRGVYIDYLLAECQKSDGTILVAEANGQVVGFVCVLCRVDSEEIVEKECQHAYITDLVVLKPHRNTGDGSQLIQAAESLAQARGATRTRNRRPRRANSAAALLGCTRSSAIAIARSCLRNAWVPQTGGKRLPRAGRSRRRAGRPRRDRD